MEKRHARQIINRCKQRPKRRINELLQDKRVLQDAADGLSVTRFIKELMRRSQGAQDGSTIALPRKYEANGTGLDLAHLFQEFSAIHSRHTHITNDNVE